MVFTSTTPWKPRNVKFFQKVRNWRNWILSVPRVSVCREKKSPWLRQYQSCISNWYVNGKVFTSTTTWEPKNLIFFLKFEIEFDLYFDLCWRAEIIQVGLNMHLYVDIGDASSSLWGSTSSYASPSSGEAYRDRRLTTNFELWVEIFCMSTCFHVRIPKPCLSVCPSVCPSICPSVRLSVRTPRKEILLASSISVLH